MRLLLLVAAMMSAVSSPSAAALARLERVVDGDTLQVRLAGNLETVRIFGIDAPERRQPGGDAARAALFALVRGGSLEVIPVDRDRYGRTVARITVREQDIGEAMVRAGQAWQYTRYDRSKALQEAQSAARQHRIGIWADPAVRAPWLWRADAQILSASAPSDDCSPSPRCTAMTSCSQARAALVRCGPGTIDGDRDGVPCEALCTPSG